MTNSSALIEALLSDPSKAAQVPRDVAIRLLVELARVQRALELELMTVPARAVESEQDAPRAPRLLTVAEAAERSRKSERWVRDHWRTAMPFAVRKGRTVLFPEPEFERWLRRT